MKDISININKARIASVTIYYETEIPRVVATIDLLAENGDKITNYSIDSGATWDKNKLFDLPISMISPINQICLQLEEIVIEHCNNRMKLLPEKEVK